MCGYDRRTVLAAAGAAVTALSGCTQRPGSGDGPGSSGGGTREKRLRLDTLDVAGSPGKAVPVVPENTVTLLDFFATYCAPCKPQMGELREVRSAFPDVHMLSITWQRDAASVRSFWNEYDGTWPVALDPQVETGAAFGVKALPTMVVLDKEGRETWRHKGLAESERIEAELEAARQ